jgi:hypothetical protein
LTTLSSTQAVARPVEKSQISRGLLWGLLIAATIANALGLFGGSWDGAFHAKYLVDTFLSPPHLLIYGGIGGTMLIGAAILGIMAREARRSKEGFRFFTRQPLLMLPVLANLGFLATGPFDDLWHRMFGRDLLTAWTVPHAILLLNLAVTALAVAGLGLWLSVPNPAGAVAAPPDDRAERAALIMLFVGLSMFLAHMWGFVMEWEAGVPIPNPVLDQTWLYAPVATFIAALCLALAEPFFPRKWWIPLLLVIVAQGWRVMIGPVLLLAGYEQVDGFVITTTLMGLSFGLISQFGQAWRPWVRHAVFGGSYVIVALIAFAFGQVAIQFTDLLFPIPLVVLMAVLGGRMGLSLADWLKKAAANE